MEEIKTNLVDSFDPKSFNNFWIFFIVGNGVGLLISLIPFCGFWLGLPFIIAGSVFYYILLYRFWVLVQDSNPGVSPGQAVGFLFIPFYNMYWAYVANNRLCEIYNKYCQERNIIIVPINVNIALFWYISSLSFIPVTIILSLITMGIATLFIPLLGIGVIALHAIFLKQLCDASVKIIDAKSNIN